MIEAVHLEKSFRGQKVLQDVSVNFSEGKIYGIIGRNGSGKTVLMKIICGLIQPDRGTVTVDGKIIGKDIDFPERLGAIIENPGFIPYLSGYQNLRNLARIKNQISAKEIRAVLEQVGLAEASEKRTGKYSLGMRQRLGIAQAIMENPKYLILDEPMNGLDNEGVREVRELLRNLKQQGRMILLASHNREDIDLLCDEVYEMDKGILKIKK